MVDTPYINQNKKIKQKVIIIAGPTASGKTSTAINIAKKIRGEIISADSMQIYKYMNIGTAKPATTEMQGIPHHLIDELYPNDDFSAAVFKEMAEQRINNICSRNNIPIIAGGTGFYINALLYDTSFNDSPANNKLRENYYKIAESEGKLKVHKILENIDPESAEKIHFNNLKRVIRAIEYFEETGEKISIHNDREKQKESKYNCLFFSIEIPRGKLYEKIELRVDEMFQNGLVEEVSWLIKNGYNESLVSMQGLGYKEVVEYIKGKCSLEQSIYNVKINTRHFAKRQLTWFRHQNNCEYINGDPMDYDDLFQKCLEFIE